MFERIVALDTEQAYSELKNQLFKEKCKLVVDEQPKRLVVEQGSLWGMTPKGVKKRIEYYLHPQDSHTRVVAKTSLTSDWAKANFLSYIIGAIFFVLPLAFAFDYEASITANRTSFLGSLAEAFGHTSYSQALVFVTILKGMAIFFLALIIVSAIADIFIYKRKDAFAEETLKVLP